jgi:hypothetical protein
MSVVRKKMRSRKGAKKPTRKKTTQKGVHSMVKRLARQQKDYVPAAISTPLRSKTPKIAGGKTVTIRHEEILTFITATSTWSIGEGQRYDIQVGDAVTFPWLSTIAANFNQYDIKSLTFKYKARCSSETPGSVYFAYQQDALDPAYTDVGSMMSSSGALDQGVHRNAIFKVPLRRSGYMTRYFVRYNPESEVLGDQMYDMGIVTITADGSTQQVGVLSVAYEVELYNPQPSSVPAALASIDDQAGWWTWWTGDWTISSLSPVTDFEDHPLTGNIDLAPDQWVWPSTAGGDYMSLNATEDGDTISIDANAIGAGSLVQFTAYTYLSSETTGSYNYAFAHTTGLEPVLDGADDPRLYAAAVIDKPVGDFYAISITGMYAIKEDHSPIEAFNFRTSEVGTVAYGHYISHVSCVVLQSGIARRAAKLNSHCQLREKPPRSNLTSKPPSSRLNRLEQLEFKTRAMAKTVDGFEVVEPGVRPGGGVEDGKQPRAGRAGYNQNKLPPAPKRPALRVAVAKRQPKFVADAKMRPLVPPSKPLVVQGDKRTASRERS